MLLKRFVLVHQTVRASSPCSLRPFYFQPVQMFVLLGFQLRTLEPNDGSYSTAVARGQQLTLKDIDGICICGLVVCRQLNSCKWIATVIVRTKDDRVHRIQIEK